MNSINFSVVFVCIIGAALAHGRSGEHGGSGGGSGEHGGSCLVVDPATTNCTGAAGTNCSDSAPLIASLRANKTSVLVCSGRSTVPRNRTIELRLAVQSCERCNCFTAASNNLNSCVTLKADPNFAKKSCRDQANLLALLNGGTGTAKVCVFNRFGLLLLENTVAIVASVSGGHH